MFENYHRISFSLYMKKPHALLLALLLATTFSFGQNWRMLRHELSIGIGPSNFLGDLGGSKGEGSHGLQSIKDLKLSSTRFAIQGSYAFRVVPRFSLRGNLSYIMVSADDQNTDNEERKNRNLHFRSPILELGLVGEVYLFGKPGERVYRMDGVKGKKLRKLNPYLFGGIAGFWFNPKAKDKDGNWTALRPLQTEGVEYPAISFAIPIGIGLKYAVNTRLSIGAELGIRKTFSDYIDDVSDKYIDHSKSDATTQYFADPSTGERPNWTVPGAQRGSPSETDSYLTAIFSVHYKFFRRRRDLPRLASSVFN